MGGWMSTLRNVSLTYAAGTVGGLLNSLAAWLFGAYGITAAAGVRLAPHLSASWLYPRLVWGGLWGFLLLLPMLRSRPVSRGLLLSLGPSLAMLLYFFPREMHAGMFGLDLGWLTPVFVLFYNAVWGVSAALWLRWSGGR